MTSTDREYHYVAGWNTPGCMPTMEPAAYPDISQAWEFLQEELRFTLSGMELPDDEVTAIEEAMKQMEKMDKPDTFYITINGGDNAFWVDTMDGPVPDTEYWEK